MKYSREEKIFTHNYCSNFFLFVELLNIYNSLRDIENKKKKTMVINITFLIGISSKKCERITSARTYSKPISFCFSMPMIFSSRNNNNKLWCKHLRSFNNNFLWVQSLGYSRSRYHKHWVITKGFYISAIR